jgi:hypothetical protein
MTVEEVKSTLPLDDMGNVYMELFDCFISPEDFISRFGESELNYDSLIANPNTTTGWKMQFDSWHEQGII